MDLIKSAVILVLASSIIAQKEAHEVKPKIVNGTNAEIAEFPFIVSLQLNGSHSCAGSLLDENWILTAGTFTKLDVIKKLIYFIPRSLHSSNA